MEQIAETVKAFVLREFLPGEEPDNLKNSTSLINGGILDSMTTLKLVAFLEDTYAIGIEAHEVDAKYFETIDAIAGLVASKQLQQ